MKNKDIERARTIMSYKYCYGRKQGRKISRALNVMLKTYSRIKRNNNMQLNSCQDLLKKILKINKDKDWKDKFKTLVLKKIGILK